MSKTPPAGWRTWLPQWRRGESGVAEATAFILIIPLITSLLFVLIDVGFNLRYRLMVDNVTQDAVRGAALDGGNNWPRTNTLSIGWGQDLQNRLYKICSSTYPTNPGRCPAGSAGAPVGSCSPKIATLTTPDVTCTSTFHYYRISPLSTNPVTSLGFHTMFTNPIVVTLTSRAAVVCQSTDVTTC